MRHCRALVRGFLRRWGVYLLLGPVIFSAGTNAPVALAAGLAGSLALPWVEAGRHHPAWLPLATMLYALAGTFPVVLTRPLWWPRHWAEAERALPLAAGAIRRSDRRLACWLMLPWQVLLLAGGAVLWRELWAARPGWTAVAWALSTVGALILSTRWMRGVRRAAAATPSPLPASTPRSQAPDTVPRVHWGSAYFLLALRRGPATGSARAAAAGWVAAVACGLATWPSAWVPGWPLAALALVGLASASTLRARGQLDLLPLRQASLHLPLGQAPWDRARRLLALWPALSGLVAALPGLLMAPGLRPPVLLAYGLVLVAGGAWEASAREEAASHRTARWLFTLVLAVAIGSEVVA